MTNGLTLNSKGSSLFDDVTYLKLFVSTEEPWDVIIKHLYSKRLPKKEVKRRIAFVVVSGSKGKVTAGRGDMWLQACDTFPTYQAGGDWEEEFEAIKKQDEEITKIRHELSEIEYLKPELIHSDGQTNWAYQYLCNGWKLTEEQAKEEVSLYGSGIIEAFSKTIPSHIRHKEGRYHFVRAIHQFAREQNKNLVAVKRGEASRLFYS
jgi:hypothetical protein